MGYIAPEESVYGVSLFERLEADAKPMSLSKGPDSAEVLRSIKRNVSNILNTRIGESLSSPNLGLVDFNDATMAMLDLSIRVKLSIKRCLEEFEPRLKEVDVLVIQDEAEPLNLRFSVAATIDTSAVHERVKISLLLDNNRKYRVVG
ncbi:type VI secretion system baseplate subunit TssE [Vibrio penaeicida]|uniref:Lysozyme n=1 Tax=Vibrio penaeicida TaxID=104609 RepID=A0AAV5NVN6_9VIBR|nr:type VI secretion system baseplate subunit TssE [Vibrio penaeicida]RTZ23349.1 type VI secretion system baseplate subunit TssE [Vibrio penaeicida]GLQ74318.1 lysozyme [Vibrio penaeicida]